MEDKPNCPLHGVRFMNRITGEKDVKSALYRCEAKGCKYEVRKWK